MRESITREFTFNNEVSCVCWYDDTLHIDDIEDNSIVINKVERSELFYLFRNFFCCQYKKALSDLKDHHKQLLKEVNTKLTEFLKEEEG